MEVGFIVGFLVGLAVGEDDGAFVGDRVGAWIVKLYKNIRNIFLLLRLASSLEMQWASSLDWQ